MTLADPVPTSPDSPTGIRASRSQRSHADLSSLLVELSRLVKAMSFYPLESAQCRALLERTYLAWQGDLARSGPFTLTAQTRGFSASSIEGRVDYSHVYNLASALTGRRIEAIEFSPALTREAFGAFARMLAGEATLSGDAPTDPLAWSVTRDGLALCSTDHGTAPADPPEDTPVEDSPATPEEAIAPATEAAATKLSEPVAAAPEPEAKPPPQDRRLEELGSALDVLEECDADEDYAALSKQIAITATELAREGLLSDVFEVAIVLTEHALGDDSRSGVQTLQAQTMLEQLATDALMPDLIERASADPGTETIRAAQVLLQLGDHAAPALFDALLKEADRKRETRLTGLFIALGDHGIGLLEQQLRRAGGARARLAVRLVGDLQHSAFTPILVGLLSSSDVSLRKQAAKALVTIGGDKAIESLIVALSSSDDELVELAASCLGELDDPRSVAALSRELENTAAANRFDCAREIVQALGAIGAEEAAPRLEAVLGLRGFSRRSKRRELKLAAVMALWKTPGRQARVALGRAAKSSDARVRERAQQILSRSGSTRRGTRQGR